MAQPRTTSTQSGSSSVIGVLTAGLAAADEEAFRQFHAAYFDRLLRYHLVIARGDELEAQEAMQETLLRVARHARRFEEEAVFWSWLTVLARSAAADTGRKRNRYWRLIARYAQSLIPWPTTHFADAEDTDEQLNGLLVASLHDLPPEERLLVEGKYLRRTTVRELARETGLTERAIEARLLRARRRLRELIVAKLRHETQT